MCVYVACYHHYTISFNKLTYIYVVRNLLMQAQDREIRSAISFWPFWFEHPEDLQGEKRRRGLSFWPLAFFARGDFGSLMGVNVVRNNWTGNYIFKFRVNFKPIIRCKYCDQEHNNKI